MLRSSVTSRKSSIARSRSESERSGRSRTWISAALQLGNRYAKRDLGCGVVLFAGQRLVLSKTSVETKSGLSTDGMPVIP